METSTGKDRKSSLSSANSSGTPPTVQDSDSAKALEVAKTTGIHRFYVKEYSNPNYKLHGVREATSPAIIKSDIPWKCVVSCDNIPNGSYWLVFYVSYKGGKQNTLTSFMTSEGALMKDYSKCLNYKDGVVFLEKDELETVGNILSSNDIVKIRTHNQIVIEGEWDISELSVEFSDSISGELELLYFELTNNRIETPENNEIVIYGESKPHFCIEFGYQPPAPKDSVSSEDAPTILSVVINHKFTHTLTLCEKNDFNFLELWDMRNCGALRVDPTAPHPVEKMTIPYASTTFKKLEKSPIISCISTAGSLVGLSSDTDRSYPVKIYKCATVAPADMDPLKPIKLEPVHVSGLADFHGSCGFFNRDDVDPQEEDDKLIACDGQTVSVYSTGDSWDQIYSIDFGTGFDQELASVLVSGVRGGYFVWMGASDVASIWNAETGKNISHIPLSRANQWMDYLAKLTYDGTRVAVCSVYGIDVYDTVSGTKFNGFLPSTDESHYSLNVLRDHFLLSVTGHAPKENNRFRIHRIVNVRTLMDDHLDICLDDYINYPLPLSNDRWGLRILGSSLDFLKVYDGSKTITSLSSEDQCHFEELELEEMSNGTRKEYVLESGAVLSAWISLQESVFEYVARISMSIKYADQDEPRILIGANEIVGKHKLCFLKSSSQIVQFTLTEVHVWNIPSTKDEEFALVASWQHGYENMLGGENTSSWEILGTHFCEHCRRLEFEYNATLYETEDGEEGEGEEGEGEEGEDEEEEEGEGEEEEEEEEGGGEKEGRKSKDEVNPIPEARVLMKAEKGDRIKKDNADNNEKLEPAVDEKEEGNEESGNKDDENDSKTSSPTKSGFVVPRTARELYDFLVINPTYLQSVVNGALIPYVFSTGDLLDVIRTFYKEFIFPGSPLASPCLLHITTEWDQAFDGLFENLLRSLLCQDKVAWIPEEYYIEGSNPLDPLITASSDFPKSFKSTKIISEYCIVHALEQKNLVFLSPILDRFKHFLDVYPEFALSTLERIAFIPIKSRKFIVDNHQIAHPPRFRLKFWRPNRSPLYKTKNPVLQVHPGAGNQDSQNKHYKGEIFAASFDALWHYLDESRRVEAEEDIPPMSFPRMLFEMFKLRARFTSKLTVEYHDFTIDHFDNPAIAALVEYKWNTIGFPYWLIRFVLECIFYVLVLTAALLQVYNNNRNALEGIFIAIIAFVVLFFLLEIGQARNNWNRYKNSGYNVLDALGFGLPLAASIQQLVVLQQNPEGAQSSIADPGDNKRTWLLSYSVLVVLFHLLFELRIAKSICKYVTIIQQAIVQIRVFFFIFAAGIIAFALAILHLLRACPVGECESDTKLKSNPFFAFSATYYFMGGMYDPVSDEFGSDSWSFHIMMIIYFFFTVILMLNVLIALINKAFEKGDDGWRLTWVENRLRYIESAENLSYNIPGFRRKYNIFPKEIYFSLPGRIIKEYQAKVEENIQKVETSNDDNGALVQALREQIEDMRRHQEDQLGELKRLILESRKAPES